MFPRALNLLALAALATLGPIAAVQAQSETPVRSEDVIAKRASKVTWATPGNPSTIDTMSVCVSPFPAKMVPAKKTIRRATPKLALTPGVKRPAARPRIVPAKPTRILPKQPMLQCPQVEIAPTMIGTLDSVESAIPFPGDGAYVLDAPQMPLLNPRAIPFQDIATMTVAQGGGANWGPLVWLFGGGAGITIFTRFLDGDNNLNRGRTLAIPNPPTLANPELPPVTTTPEPGTMILVGTGLAGIAGAYRRRTRK